MKVVKLDSTFRGTEWRKAFADRLIQLRPDMNPDAADEVSDSEFMNSSSFSPFDAAERYAEDDLAAQNADGQKESGSLPFSARAPRRG